MDVIKCPACRKSLRVSDASAAKRVRCSACQKPFVVPDMAVELEEVQEVQEVEEERVTKRPRRYIEEEEEESPRRSRRNVEEEEEEERPRRPRPRRPRDDDREDISPSMAPLVYGILSCVFSCAPLIGFILGVLARSKADAEMDRLPGGRRARAARKQLQLAKTLGIVGMCLSGVALVVAVVLRITNRWP
jgi:predicted Zn finger-like uncharacterized protein